jgi:hypothetical protein
MQQESNTCNTLSNNQDTSIREPQNQCISLSNSFVFKQRHLQSQPNNNLPTPSPLKGPKNKWKKSYTRGVQAKTIESTETSTTKQLDDTILNEEDKENHNNLNLPSQDVPKTPTKNPPNNSRPGDAACNKGLKRKVISPLASQQAKSDSQAKFLVTSHQVSSCRVTGIMTSPDTARLSKRVAFNKSAKEAVPQYPRQVRTALKFVF